MTVHSTQESVSRKQGLAVIQAFKDLSIGSKLSIGLGILVVLTLLMVGLSWLGSAAATDKIDTTGEVRVPTALLSSHTQANLLRTQADVQGYLALGKEEYRDSYHSSLVAFQQNLAELQARRSSLDRSNRARLDELQTAFEAWAPLPDQLFDLRDDQLEREPAYKLLATDGLRMGGTVLIGCNELIDAQGRREPTAENIALLADMANFQGSFAAMLSGLRGYVTTQNRVFISEYEANLAVNNFAWQRLYSQANALSDEQQETLKSIDQNRGEFLLLPDQMFEILDDSEDPFQWRLDLYRFTNEAVPQARTMLTLLDQITADQQRLLREDLNTGRQGLSLARTQTLVGGIIAVILGLLLALVLWRNISLPVRRLTVVAEQIRGGDLEAQAHVESRDEIGTLAETFNNMTGKLRQTLMQVRKEKRRADDLLDVVIPIGVELASEKDFNRLLEKMLLEAKEFCHADAGTLYLRTEEKTLRFVILRNDSRQVALGGTTGQAVPFAALPLYDPATGEPRNECVATHVALIGSSVNIADTAQCDEFEFGVEQDQKAMIGEYQTTSLLTIPLKSSSDQVLGVLQLINAQDPETGEIVAFDENLQQMMESFSSLAVAALEAYIREQSLRQEIQQLRIEIDEARRQKQVGEIVDSDFFQELKQKARTLRQRQRPPRADTIDPQPSEA